MNRRNYLVAVVILHLLVLGAVAHAQVDPVGSTATDTQSAAPPAGTTATDASADPNQLPTDTTDTALTDTTATDGTAPTTTTVPALPGPWRLHIPGVELETEAWLLPLVAFVVSLLLGGILHAALVAHDVKKWPRTSGSWWKLRLLPFLPAATLLILTYFFFIRGLDEELLRIAGPRVRNWLYGYGLAVFVLWLLLPRPKVPTHAAVTA